MCEGVTGLVVDGPLVLADGVLELERDEGAWVLRASQKGFRMVVSCPPYMLYKLNHSYGMLYFG